MDSLQTIGIQITMNNSEIDNKEMLAPKTHHIHHKLASPSTGLPSGQGDAEDTRQLASLDTQHRAKQDRKRPKAH